MIIIWQLYCHCIDCQAIEEAATNSPHPPSPAPMPGSSLPGHDDDDDGNDGCDDGHGFGNDDDNSIARWS